MNLAHDFYMAMSAQKEFGETAKYGSPLAWQAVAGGPPLIGYTLESSEHVQLQLSFVPRPLRFQF